MYSGQILGTVILSSRLQLSSRCFQDGVRSARIVGDSDFEDKPPKRQKAAYLSTIAVINHTQNSLNGSKINDFGEDADNFLGDKISIPVLDIIVPWAISSRLFQKYDFCQRHDARIYLCQLITKLLTTLRR